MLKFIKRSQPKTGIQVKKAASDFVENNYLPIKNADK